MTACHAKKKDRECSGWVISVSNGDVPLLTSSHWTASNQKSRRCVGCPAFIPSLLTAPVRLQIMVSMCLKTGYTTNIQTYHFFNGEMMMKNQIWVFSKKIRHNDMKTMTDWLKTKQCVFVEDGTSIKSWAKLYESPQSVNGFVNKLLPWLPHKIRLGQGQIYVIWPSKLLNHSNMNGDTRVYIWYLTKAAV